VNTRQQQFAEMVASGTTTAKDAHRAIYGTDGHAAGAGGSRLLRNREVAAHIASIRQAAETVATMTLREKREFLARIVRATPADAIADPSLGAEVTELPGGGRRVRLPDKLRAIELDSRLAGDFAQGATAGDGPDPLAVLIAGIRGGRDLAEVGA
jgi:hypothetical protein